MLMAWWMKDDNVIVDTCHVDNNDLAAGIGLSNKYDGYADMQPVAQENDNIVWQYVGDGLYDNGRHGICDIHLLNHTVNVDDCSRWQRGRALEQRLAPWLGRLWAKPDQSLVGSTYRR